MTCVLTQAAPTGSHAVVQPFHQADRPQDQAEQPGPHLHACIYATIDCSLTACVISMQELKKALDPNYAAAHPEEACNPHNVLRYNTVTF